MLTIFSTPKAFKGHFALIQANAIESWKRLADNVDVILFGNEPGTAEICKRLSLRHVADVRTNELGTPLLSDMFEQARIMARHEMVCYANADIILMRDLLQALETVKSWREGFLVVGQRCDVDITQRLDFEAPGWDDQLRDRATRQGKHRPPGWIDYFAFARASMPTMPPFAVGRPGWDNWLLWNTRTRNIPVVDATQRVLVVHQNHDYSHHAAGQQGVALGVEAAQNSGLIGTWARMFTIADANYRLTPSGIKRNVSGAYFRRRLEFIRRRLIDWSRPIRRRLGLRVLNPSQSENT